MGELTLLGVEQMRFAYKMLAEGTSLEGSRLFIRHQKGKVRCDSCGYEGAIQVKDDPLYHVSYPSLTCPKCGSTANIIEGKECLIQRVKMVV